jgi:hypothetical protein
MAGNGFLCGLLKSTYEAAGLCAAYIRESGPKLLLNHFFEFFRRDVPSSGQVFNCPYLRCRGLWTRTLLLAAIAGFFFCRGSCGLLSTSIAAIS